MQTFKNSKASFVSLASIQRREEQMTPDQFAVVQHIEGLLWLIALWTFIGAFK